MKLNPALKSFWKTKKQIKILHGGRMSSKTMDTAGVILYLASKYKLRVACLRRFQNKLSESVFSTLKGIATRDDRLSTHYITTENTIKSKIGSDFIFMGIQRNLEEIKGLDDIDITWIEEAEKLTKEQWDLIRPTVLRKENSFVIMVFNAKLQSDYVYTEFVMKEHSNVLVHKINYDQNPFLSNSAKELIEADKQNLDDDEFQHIYYGVPKSEDEHSLIKRSWVEASINAHEILEIDMSGARAVGYDVADSGEDKNATVVFDGSICVDIDEWKAGEDELKESSLRAWALVENGRLIYDSIGVGAGVGAIIKDIPRTNNKYFKFNAGAGVVNPDDNYAPNITNKEKFENLKAQAWRDVADRFRNTYNAINKGESFNPSELISISSNVPHLERLKTELCLPRKSVSKRGLDMVETKDSLKKRGFSSPNLADGFIMGSCPHLVKNISNELDASQFD